MKRVDRSVFPASFAQERLWFLEQLRPGNLAYNLQRALHLAGALDITLLERSLAEIIRRHEVLRTTFSAGDGQPFQVVGPPWPVHLPVIEICAQPGPERQQAIQRLAIRDASQPFDLAQGPLLRLTLLRLESAEHVLLMTFHHIVYDGWSQGVILRELSALYQAYSAGRPSPLPNLPIQYAGYVVWQREWMQGDILAGQLTYWRNQLAGNLPRLELPADRPRSSERDRQGIRRSLALSQPLTDALHTLSRREGVTLFMTILAAFKVLLYRYTGQADIVVGAPIAGRNRAEFEDLVGFFVNSLALRTDLSGNPTFRELLHRVRRVALEAYAHQDLPFEKLVEELQPERDPERNPLFDIVVNHANVPRQTLQVPGLSGTLLNLVEPAPRFQMTLYIDSRESALRLHLAYCSAQFATERITCLLQQLQYVLEQVVATPEMPIRSCSLVTPESRPLLPDPSAPLAEPAYPPVPEMFAAWAARQPEGPAVTQGGKVWTYADLAEGARSLAHALLAQGLTRGDVVAVTGPRSFGLITAMMAALQSGGALLAIDPALPPFRQRMMLQEAGARYVLAIGDPRSAQAWWSEISRLATIYVESESGRMAGQGASVSHQSTALPTLDPDGLAYVFFTSGTSGVPRGVLGCHKGLSHFLHWQRQTFSVQPQDRCAQLTGVSFDVVLRDVFLPLVSGATLCLPDEAAHGMPGGVLPWLEREGITLLHTVPALAQTWLADAPSSLALRALRWVFFAGEPLTEALVQRWRTAFPLSGRIVNLYGPTETTLAKCFYEVPSDVLPGVQPVGRPLPATQALVLRQDGQLCGISEPGEIVLRTPFCSLGYVNAPAETQKRFVKNPYRDDVRDVLYYTGDGGRYRPDGTLETLGRLDHQLKIRGVRVEPDEVAAVLAQHPRVASCVVVGRKDLQGEDCLVAYVVPSQSNTQTIPEWRSFLSSRLPSPLIPSAFVLLQSLPLTPQGKVDRQALPAPDTLREEPEIGEARPRTALEAALAEIWAKVLGVDHVAVDDNFFERGGHSLLAIRVIARVHATFHVDLPLLTFFEAPTVAEAALAIARELAQRAQHDPVAREVAALAEASPDACRQEGGVRCQTKAT